jgi:hypothetical protein
MQFLRLFPILLAFGFGIPGFGQTPDSMIMQPNSTMMRRLLSSRSVFQIQTIMRKQRGNIDIGVPMHTNHLYDLYKKSDGLYAHISATGIIYRITEASGGDSVLFRRMDRTTHFGYNINALGFTLNDRLYNFGGYGYWRWNGQLRAYNEGMSEWHIVPLERELPVTNGGPHSFMWLDAGEERLFVLRTLRGNEAVLNDPIRWADTTHYLRLNDLRWFPIGTAPKIEVSNDILRVLVSLDSGLLLQTNGGIEYWNFLRNRVRTIVNDSLRAELLTMEGNHYMWYDAGRFFIGDAHTGKLDSIALSASDFVDTPRTVYLPFESPFGLLAYLVAGGLTTAFFVAWVWKRRRSGSGAPMNRDPGEPLRQDTDIRQVENIPRETMRSVEEVPRSFDPDLFDAVEWSLICLLGQHGLEPGRTTSTQEVNRILGVANKTLDMQKRKRSDVIRAINRKYQLVFPDRTGELIIKERSEQDGRQSEYRINPTEIPQIRDHLPRR